MRRKKKLTTPTPRFARRASSHWLGRRNLATLACAANRGKIGSRILDSWRLWLFNSFGYHAMKNTSDFSSHRRRLLRQLASLSGTGGLRFIAPSTIPWMLWMQSARADPGTITAAIAVATTVLQMMKSSGDLDREFNAVNLKLDALLDGQRAILASILAIDKGLDELRALVADMPSETVGLGLTVEIGGLFSTLRNELTQLRRAPDNHARRKTYEGLRGDLKSMVSKLGTATAVGARRPIMVQAAQFAARAARLFERHDRELRLGGRDARIDLLNVAGQLQDMLHILVGTADQGIPGELDSRIADTSAKLASLRDGAMKSDYAVFVKMLAEEDRNRKEWEAANPEPTQHRLSFCMQGPEKVSSLGYETLRGGEMQKADGFVSDSRHERLLVTIPFMIDRYIAYGGRPFFHCQASHKKEWAQSMWSMDTRRVVTNTRDDTKVIRSDDPKKLVTCQPLPEAAEGAPKLFALFTDFLARTAANVAIESRLLALRDDGRRTLEDCKRLENRLKT